MQYYQERWRKLLLSPPVLFMLYGGPFGVITELSNYPSGQRSLLRGVFTGGFFGVAMTLVTVLTTRKFNKRLGITSTEQRIALDRSVKKGVLPQDPALLKALPVYIDQRIRQNRNLRKYGPFQFLLYTLLDVYLTISEHSWFWPIVGLYIIGLAVYAYRNSTARLHKLEQIRQKLAAKP